MSRYLVLYRSNVSAADQMQKAVTKVIAEGKTLTRDLGGKASTTKMGDAIAAAL